MLDSGLLELFFVVVCMARCVVAIYVWLECFSDVESNLLQFLFRFDLIICLDNFPSHCGILRFSDLSDVYFSSGLTAKRMKENGSLFFTQLLLPICNSRESGIDGDDGVPFFSQSRAMTNMYAVGPKN